MRYLVWAIPEFIDMLFCYNCFTHPVPVIFPKCKLNSANMSFQLLDNSTTKPYSLIPNQEWSYRRRTISNKQSNKTLHHSSISTEQLERQKIMQHLPSIFEIQPPKPHFFQPPILPRGCILCFPLKHIAHNNFY